MTRLDATVLKTIITITGLPTAQLARLLDRPIRTIDSWKTNTPSQRGMPGGEVERLCLLLDPKGERQDIIGWIVLAARSRSERSIKTAAAWEREKAKEEIERAAEGHDSLT